MKQTDSLMAAREAQGLQLVVVVRLAYVVAFAPGDLAFVQEASHLLYWFLILFLFVGICVFFIRQLRRRWHVNAIGVAGALFDVLVIGIGVMVWSRMTDTAPAMAAHRSMLPMAAMLAILINGLALKPRYPIIVTAGILVIMATALVIGRKDTAISERFLELKPGPDELSPGLFLGAVLMVLISGVVTVIITWLSRKTVHKAVQLERVNSSLAESQAEVVIEEKIAALTQLATGVSHELNTPLGAMSSTTDTTSRLAARVREILEQGEEVDLAEGSKLRRTLESLEASTRVAHDAGERIGQIVETLRQFIRLDESERKPVSLPDVLEETLNLLRHQLGRRIKVETRYDELPMLTCYPRRLNQVFFTIIRNAAESIAGPGTISIAAGAMGDSIRIRISDTGRGIAPDTLKNLFDIRFSRDESRVRAPMGLPICRSVIRRHGGSISVESEVGRGTTFTIDLPLSADAPKE